jgi:hypothetical protein
MQQAQRAGGKARQRALEAGERLPECRCEVRGVEVVEGGGGDAQPARWGGVGWVGLGWVGLGWVGLGWVGLGWVGLGWIGCQPPGLQKIAKKKKKPQ